MGLTDKIKNEAENLIGKGKEALGHATGNENLEDEGQYEQTKAKVKKTGERAKDTAKDIVDD